MVLYSSYRDKGAARTEMSGHIYVSHMLVPQAPWKSQGTQSKPLKKRAITKRQHAKQSRGAKWQARDTQTKPRKKHGNKHVS